VEDRDAAEPDVLVDTVYRGKPSKLLLHADRNGFFYVLDRGNGKVLLAKPFLHRMDWASSIGADGRPVVKDPRVPQRCRQLGLHRFLTGDAPVLFPGAGTMRQR
jgi:glucose dehydrogenase